METVRLDPNYENTIKWFAEALADHSFDKGSLTPVISLIEQVRYLWEADRPAFNRALDYLRRREAIMKGRRNRFIREEDGEMDELLCLDPHDEFGSIEFIAPSGWKGSCEWHNADGTFDREAYLETKKGGGLQD